MLSLPLLFFFSSSSASSYYYRRTAYLHSQVHKSQNGIAIIPHNLLVATYIPVTCIMNTKCFLPSILPSLLSASTQLHPAMPCHAMPCFCRTCTTETWE
ncbi:hypothetical protein L873DRAFT_1441388 [Choiromyces venosus 120613-1]|uniref:Uncharacterized protein n=1 Tax=Choiromyces venosus 120613-1 TaxID=1336337 RepID=A0A3N4J7J6_9PEZI|nr:hypothetical protein L873DRAFT_1441388 [Choiromyces venosus 120613-1]